MATNYNILIKRFNGSDWDILRPLTLSDNVSDDAQNNKFVNATQTTWIESLRTRLTYSASAIKSTVLFEAPTVTATTKVNSPDFTFPAPTQSAQNWRIRRMTDGLEIETNANKMMIAGNAEDTSYLNGNWQMDAGYSPNNPRSIVNKGYVDNLGMGVKPTTAVKVASTANVALTGITSIDGVSLANGDRVLLKDQTTKTQNGIYTWATGGALTKASVTGNDNQNGTLVRVTAGTANKNDTFYAQDYTAGEWILFDSNLELIAGAGITVVGGTISIGSGAITNAMLAGSIQAGKINLGAGISNISNAIGISSGAITNAMLAGSIEDSKLADLPLINTAMMPNAWTLTQDNVSTSLFAHLGYIYNAIKALRGTTNYNTSNAQTIAGAYSKIDNDLTGKNSTTLSNSNPANTNRVTGDLHFQYS